MYERIIAAINGTIWAIAPEKMDAMLAVLDMRCHGIRADAETIAAVTEAARRDRASRQQKQEAILPVLGTITQRADMITEASGFASADAIGKEFDRLMADASVSAVVLDIDSPGGSVFGIEELGDKIFSARGGKPIVAVANSYAASAAYWVATAADELVVAPGGQAGSVGVMAVHVDASGLNEQVGLRPTYVHYGKNKVEYSEDFPLSEDARDELQRTVDAYGKRFDAAVARNRGTTAAEVRDNFGQGRVYLAKEAVSRGMADRVDTLEATIGRLQAGTYRKPRRAAQALQNRLTLRRHLTR